MNWYSALCSDIETCAKKCVGNWRSWSNFGWHYQPEDSNQWFILYTHNRDSDVLELSNADVIEEELSKFDHDTCRVEDHNHWAVGWIKGFSIRVYDSEGNITPAFKAVYDIANQLSDYPVLDESDFSERETEVANETWTNCYNLSERIEYIRDHRSQFEFHSFADMLGCVRGKYFAGYASELLQS